MESVASYLKGLLKRKKEGNRFANLVPTPPTNPNPQKNTLNTNQKTKKTEKKRKRNGKEQKKIFLLFKHERANRSFVNQREKVGCQVFMRTKIHLNQLFC